MRIDYRVDSRRVDRLASVHHSARALPGDDRAVKLSRSSQRARPPRPRHHPCPECSHGGVSRTLPPAPPLIIRSYPAARRNAIESPMFAPTSIATVPGCFGGLRPRLSAGCRSSRGIHRGRAAGRATGRDALVTEHVVLNDWVSHSDERSAHLEGDAAHGVPPLSCNGVGDSPEHHLAEPIRLQLAHACLPGV